MKVGRQGALFFSLCLSAHAFAAQTISNTAIKLDPEFDHVAPLPLSASEAAQRSGLLDPKQVEAIIAARDKLFASMAARDESGWTGPPLMFSNSSVNALDRADLATFREELNADSITIYDPYSLGQRAGSTYGVIMVRPSRASKETMVALAFVLKGTTVERIVIAPQPWIIVAISTD